MHKAIAVLQYKEEGQIIKRHPEYGMEERILLSAIRYDRGTVTIDGKEYPMRDMNFPDGGSGGSAAADGRRGRAASHAGAVVPPQRAAA